MRRHSGGCTTTSDPITRATAVGLPSFNFVEPRRPPDAKKKLCVRAAQLATVPTLAAQLPALNSGERTPRPESQQRQQAARGIPIEEAGIIDVDAMLDAAIRARISQMRDTIMPEHQKAGRLWQSLQRLSDSGRFSGSSIESPNPITAALCVQVVSQVVRAAAATMATESSAPSMVPSTLLGALGNCVYFKFDPDVSLEAQQSFADVVTEQSSRIAQLEQRVAELQLALDASKFRVEEQLRSVTLLFERMPAGERPRAITESLGPFLNRELLLILWNATATSIAMRTLEQDVSMAPTQRSSATAWGEARKRGAKLAAHVLQERVHLVTSLWQTMSREERGQLYKALDPSTDGATASGNGNAPNSIKAVLRSLEDAYAAEQIHRRRQLSIGRLGALTNSSSAQAERRHDSKIQIPSAPPRQLAPKPLLTSLSFAGGGKTDTGASDEPPAITIPDVLLGAFASSKTSEDSHASILLEDSVQPDKTNGLHDGSFTGSLGPIVRVCEDAFDLLCEDAFDTKLHTGEKASVPAGGGGNVVQAKKLLCKLLAALSASSDAIVDKFQRSENARLEALEEARALQAGELSGSMDEGMSALVQTIIRRQRQNPALLVTAINRSPDILTSAIAHNQGILFFAMTKFSSAVKRFLRLDPKACDNLDSLSNKNKGIQLLWNGNTTGTAGVGITGVVGPNTARLDQNQLTGEASGASNAQHLLEWFSAHVGDFAMLFLENPDALKQLFIEMHEHGDVTAFYRLMVLLQSTKGVHNFMTRASIAALERVAQEDQASVTHLLHSIFIGDGAGNRRKSKSDGVGDSSATGSTVSKPTTTGNRDLLHELRSSPYLVTCLSEFQPGVLQDVFATHIDTWASYFVDIVSSNDAILRQSLVTRTESVEGGEAFLKLFDAMITGATGRLNLQLLEWSVLGSDAARVTEREASARRKQHQCLYLRGHSTVFSAIISPQIVYGSYNPHAIGLQASAPTAADGQSTEVASRSKGGSKDSKSVVGRSSRSRRANNVAVSLSASTKKRAAHSGSMNGAPGSGVSADDSSPSVASCSPVKETSDHIDAAKTRSRQRSSSTGAEPSVSVAEPRVEAQSTFEIPRCWQMFLQIHRQQQQQAGEIREATAVDSDLLMRMTRAQTRSLVLDVWIEFIKTDHLQVDNASLGALAPFVCDYFVGRYDSPAAVGSWLKRLVESMQAHHEDPRVRFFAGACGFFSFPMSTMANDASGSRDDFYEQPEFDTVLYYLHVLAHLFYGQMKIFKPENHLSEEPGGSCAIDVEVAQATITTVFGASITKTATEALQRELAAVPRVANHPSLSSASSVAVGPEGDESRQSARIGPTCGAIELDNVMAVFLREWHRRLKQIDERYKEEFAAQDTGGGRIGLDEFVKIVTTVTGGRVSARECRLVYADVGLELLDCDAFVRVTRAYKLRLFDAQLPEVHLQDSELQELLASLGRTNIASTQRELEDLVRHWRGVQSELASQLTSLHQKKATKVLLKRQGMLVDRLLAGVVHQAAPLIQKQQSLADPPTSGSIITTELQPLIDRAWHEVRACVKLLHSAKLTNHYLSGLYIQSSLVKWIRQARRRAQEEERARTLEALNC